MSKVKLSIQLVSMGLEDYDWYIGVNISTKCVCECKLYKNFQKEETKLRKQSIFIFSPEILNKLCNEKSRHEQFTLFREKPLHNEVHN